MELPKLPSADGFLRIVIGLLVLLALAALVFGGWWLFKGSYDRGVVEEYVQEGNARVGNQIAIANELMADERAADVTIVTTQTEELRNADIETGDGLSARQRHGCLVMRQQGQDLSRHPPCDRLKK